jgi:hypothetical protein
MLKPQLIALCCLLFVCATTTAQQDSTLESLQQLPLKYISNINSKVDKYSIQGNSKKKSNFKDQAVRITKVKEYIKCKLECHQLILLLCIYSR